MTQEKDYTTIMKVSYDGYMWLKEHADRYHSPLATLLRIVVVDELSQMDASEIAGLPEMPDDGAASLQFKMPGEIVRQAGGKDSLRNFIRYILQQKADEARRDDETLKKSRQHEPLISYAAA